MFRYVDVLARVAADADGEYRTVDTSALASKGIAIVAFPGGNASPWVEREEFRGREEIPEIIEAARLLLDEAEAIAQEERDQRDAEGSGVLSSVSAFQAFAALDEAGYLDAVEAYMADPATPRIERLAFQKAQEFRRNSPLIARIAEKFGISEAQLDELFIQAYTIEA